MRDILNVLADRIWLAGRRFLTRVVRVHLLTKKEILCSQSSTAAGSKIPQKI